MNMTQDIKTTYGHSDATGNCITVTKTAKDAANQILKKDYAVRFAAYALHRGRVHKYQR